MICTKNEKHGIGVEMRGSLAEVKADLAAIGRAIKASCDAEESLKIDELVDMVRQGTKMTDEEICRMYVEADPRWKLAQKIMKDDVLFADFLDLAERFMKEKKHERED